jgi:hypothetical protein
MNSFTGDQIYVDIFIMKQLVTTQLYLLTQYNNAQINTYQPIDVFRS